MKVTIDLRRVSCRDMGIISLFNVQNGRPRVNSAGCFPIFFLKLYISIYLLIPMEVAISYLYIILMLLFLKFSIIIS